MIIPHIIVVRQKTAAIVESWGRFEKVLHAGTYIVLPWQSVAGRVSLKVQELQVNVETKTKDDVFVHLLEHDKEMAATVRQNHESLKPAFAKVMEGLSPYVSPYRPQTWQTPKDSVANVFYRWQAEDWRPEA